LRIWDAAIVQRRQLTGEFSSLLLQFDTFHPFEFEPGQFIMLGLPEKFPWVLRQPFTILEGRTGSLEILLSSRMDERHWIDDVREGTALDFIGPLGHPFDFSEVKESLLILAEGEGVAAAYAAAKKAKIREVPTTVIWSGARAGDFALEGKFAGLGLGSEQVLKVTTDPNSGFHSTLSEFVRNYLKNHRSVFISGSDKFINKSQQILKSYGRRGQVAVLPRSGCGVGVCLACIVKTKDGYRRACTSGPVFSTEQEVSL